MHLLNSIINYLKRRLTRKFGNMQAEVSVVTMSTLMQSEPGVEGVMRISFLLRLW